MTKVFRPGVFDLFHVGHLNCIRKAASLGTHLIVGVQDDRDVLACKNKSPIVKLKDRMEIISELKSVNEVISYRNSDLSKLIKYLDIDILSVGDDYGSLAEFPEQVKTLNYCEANNIKVVKTPRTQGVSSTKLLSDSLKFWNDLSAENKNVPTTLTSFQGDKKLIQQQTNLEINIFKKHIKKNDNLLDLGCGDGRIDIGLSEFCNSIVAVDFSERLINELRNHKIQNINPVISNVCNFDPKGALFDSVIISGLFPCLDDTSFEKVLQICKKSIKSTGDILIRTSIADNDRIDVINQFSNDLGCLYTAYYRTKEETDKTMSRFGFASKSYIPLYRNHQDTHIAFMRYCPR